MGKTRAPLDIIEFFPKCQPEILGEIVSLYRKGLSISDIAEQTGFKRTRIWTVLKKHNAELRSQNPVSFDRWRKGHGKSKARPPYGYCYFQGSVIKDPREYPTLQLILSLKKQGQSISSIQRHLNGKKLYSRTNRTWSYNVIKSIVERKKLPFEVQSSTASNSSPKIKRNKESKK